MPRLRVLLFLFSALVVSIAPAHGATDRVVVFGDSLSDNGNLANFLSGEQAQILRSWPYANGRVTNGFVGVEWLARFLRAPNPGPFTEGGTNFAVAGAHARETGDTRDDLISLDAQVKTHLSLESGRLSPNTLYVIFIGANDARDARSASTRNAAVVIARATSRAIRVAALRLIRAGARKVLIMNIADIGRIPETRLLAQASGITNLAAETTLRSVIFNRLIEREVLLLKQRTVAQVHRYNVFSAVRLLQSGVPDNGFIVGDRGCLVLDNNVINFNSACNNGANLNRFIFFDPIHPSATTHRIIGRSMFLSLPVSMR